MYTDTRSRSFDVTLKRATYWEYLYKSNMKRATIGSYSNVPVKRPFSSQTVTSVRGPRPRGRLTHTNPCTMKKLSFHDSLVSKTHLNGPNVILNGPLISHNDTLYKRFVLEGSPFSYSVLSDTNMFTLAYPPYFLGDRNYVLQKAYAKANDTIASVMVSLAELRETLAMLRSPLQGLRLFLGKLLKNAKRLKGMDLERSLKDTWLEYRYGIMPLVLDTENLMEAFEAKASNLYAFRATVRRKVPIDRVTKTLVAGAATFHVVYETSDVVKTCVGLYTRPLPSDRYGLSWTQLLPTAWELVPWSFVWNWFIDVDTWINGVMSAMHVHPESGYVTVKSIRQRRAKLDKISWYTLTKDAPPPYFVQREAEVMQRTIDCGVDWTTIHFNNAFTTSWRRMVDSVALLWKKPTKIIKLLKTIKGS